MGYCSWRKEEEEEEEEEREREKKRFRAGNAILLRDKSSYRSLFHFPSSVRLL